MKERIKNPPKRIVFIVCMLIIPLLGFAVFTVYANFGGVILSLKQAEKGVEYFAGFDNYIRFFKGMKAENYAHTVWVSLGYLGVVGCISLPISLVVAFFLSKKIPCSKALIVILYLPNIIPAAVLAEFYRRLWDSGGGIVATGALNKFFALLTGQEINWLASSEYANKALWLYTVWFGFGFNAIMLLGAVSRIPAEVVESAELDGAGLFVEFFRITIPMIWSTLSMIIILTLMVPATVYMQPLLMGGNRADTTTLALLVMQQLKVNADPYFASAISISVAAVTLVVIMTAKKLLDKAFTVVEV